MPLSSELCTGILAARCGRRASVGGRRLPRLGRTDLVECAELGVSELVANAILHAAAPITVRRARHRRATRGSRSSTARRSRPCRPPRSRATTSTCCTTFGRGLSMVAQCAVAWGADDRDDGKIVWFEPAPELRDDGVVEWVIDQPTTATAPEPTSERPRSTCACSASTCRSTARSTRQYRELRRELRLLSLAHQSDYPLAGDLPGMFANFERQFPAPSATRSSRREARGAAARRPRVPDRSARPARSS